MSEVSAEAIPQSGPWVPFLSAMAGGIIAGLASLAGLFVSGRQQSQARKGDREAARQQALVRSASRTTTILAEAMQLVITRTEVPQDYDQRLQEVCESLMGVQVADPSTRIAGLAGDLVSDLNVVLLWLRRRDLGEEKRKEMVESKVKKAGTAVSLLIDEARSVNGLPPVPEGRASEDVAVT